MQTWVNLFLIIFIESSFHFIAVSLDITISGWQLSLGFHHARIRDCNYPQGSLAQIGHSIICDVYNLHIQHAWDYMYYITHPLAILYDKRWLTHWGWMAHICVSKLNIIGSDNGLAPGRCQAIIRTNPGILLIGPSGTNFNECLMKIRPFSFKKMRLKVSSAKWRPFVSISMY